jgi:DNA-binding PadR family transcriptional regulator
LITHSVEDGKKIYRLTDRGRAALQERAGAGDLEADIGGVC